MDLEKECKRQNIRAKMNSKKSGRDDAAVSEIKKYLWKSVEKSKNYDIYCHYNDNICRIYGGTYATFLQNTNNYRVFQKNLLWHRYCVLIIQNYYIIYNIRVNLYTFYKNQI